MRGVFTRELHDPKLVTGSVVVNAQCADFLQVHVYRVGRGVPAMSLNGLTRLEAQTLLDGLREVLS